MAKAGAKRVRFDEVTDIKPAKKPREGQAWRTRFAEDDQEDESFGEQLQGAAQAALGRSSHLEGEVVALPDEAAARRFLKRGELEATGTGSLLDDVHEAEADYDEPDELFTYDGVPLEPFNLTREKETGYFDTEGNYLEFANNEDTDAWLEQFAEDVVTFVKAKDAAAAAAAQQEMADQDEQPKLSDEAVQDCKRRLIRLLQPGENVLAALRRLGLTRKQDRRAAKAAAQQAKKDSEPAASTPGSGPQKSRLPPENRAAFEVLTDASSMLLASGVFSAHSHTKEEFEREVAAADALDSVDIFAAGAADLAEPGRDAAGQPMDVDAAEQAAPLPAAAAAPTGDSRPDPDIQGAAARALPAETSIRDSGQAAVGIAAPAISAADVVRLEHPTQSDAAAALEPDTPMQEAIRPEQAVQPEAAGCSVPGGSMPAEQLADDSLGEGVYDEASGMWYYSRPGCFWDAASRTYIDAQTGERWGVDVDQSGELSGAASS